MTSPEAAPRTMRGNFPKRQDDCRHKEAIRLGIAQWALDEDDSEAELWQFVAAAYARLAGEDSKP